jgi:N-acetylmuramoyl-L-alanine amidase.
MPKTLLPLLSSIFLLSQPGHAIDRPISQGSPVKEKARTPVIIWQPSHQTDTGVDFNEAVVSNGIVEAAMKTMPLPKEYEVWSLGVKNLHHADAGSNTVIEHTTMTVNGQISGYAYELQQSNQRNPDVFIAVHNNGGTNRHAVWGYVHDGDKFEAENRTLAARLVRAITAATNLQNGGVLLDSSTGRNNYRCKSTGKLSFYSLDENVNNAPYRVLLEIGDNSASRAFLKDPANQQLVGEAIKKALVAWLADTWKD